MKAGYVHCVKMADLSRCGNLVFFAPEILGKITVVTLGGSTEYSGGRKYAFLTSICCHPRWKHWIQWWQKVCIFD